MGLLESIFPAKNRKTDKVQEYFKTLTAYSPVFTSFEGSLYEAMQTRAAIHAFATHCSKLKPEIVGSGNERLARILQHRPNPWMNTAQFLYRIATIYSTTNNVFIAPIYAADGESIIGYYPMLPERVEIVRMNGKMYLRYSFAGGQKAAVEYERAGHMMQMQYRNDFFGEKNEDVMYSTLQMIDIQNQGIMNAVKSGASLRFIAKLAQTLKKQTIDEEREQLRESNLSAENNGGFLLFDAKYSDIKQIDSKPYVADERQMQLINTNIFNFFGVNEDILQNKYSEETYNAFYEGKIEPFAINLGLTLTNMSFSNRELAFGNEIMFSANRLQYASTSAKLQVSQQLFDRGILSQNDVLDIWQLPHIEGGDRHFIRGEYKDTAVSDDETDETGSVDVLIGADEEQSTKEDGE